MKTTSYWLECIECAFDSAGISATKEQKEMVASDVESGHENYGMAHGYDCIPNPIDTENTRLKQQLDTERRKIVCRECKSKGRIYTYEPHHGSDSQCDACRGEGRRLP